jgi:hypothetical protein
MNFKERVDILRSQIEEIKKEFAAYIADTSVPLDERWEVFMSAPSDLREHSRWIERFEGLPDDDFIGYGGPVWVERHQTVDISDILSVLEGQEDYDFDFSAVDVTAFKEDVLKRNLYSFEYDW